MDNRLPTESEIVTLHKKYATSEKIFDAVYTHCLAVWRIAEDLITTKDIKLNRELVKCGCLLHDIGTYSLIEPTDDISVNYAGRGVEGERLLIEEGFSKDLCHAVAHHVAHGLTEEFIKESCLPLPHRDLTPKTTEERLVSYVTKLHARSADQQFISITTYRNFLGRLDIKNSINDFEFLVEEFGEPNLHKLAEEFGHKLV